MDGWESRIRCRGVIVCRAACAVLAVVAVIFRDLGSVVRAGERLVRRDEALHLGRFRRCVGATGLRGVRGRGFLGLQCFRLFLRYGRCPRDGFLDDALAVGLAPGFGLSATSQEAGGLQCEARVLPGRKSLMAQVLKLLLRLSSGLCLVLCAGIGCGIFCPLSAGEALSLIVSTDVEGVASSTGFAQLPSSCGISSMVSRSSSSVLRPMAISGAWARTNQDTAR